jgi:hypothetical protein
MPQEKEHALDREFQGGASKLSIGRVGKVGELLSAMKWIPRAAVFLICCAKSLHGGAAIPLEDGRERGRRPDEPARRSYDSSRGWA